MHALIIENGEATIEFSGKPSLVLDIIGKAVLRDENAYVVLRVWHDDKFCAKGQG